MLNRVLRSMHLYVGDTSLFSKQESDLKAPVQPHAAKGTKSYGSTPCDSTNSPPSSSRRSPTPRAWRSGTTTPTSSRSTCCSALLDQDDGGIAGLLAKAGGNRRSAEEGRSRQSIARLPKVEGTPRRGARLARPRRNCSTSPTRKRRSAATSSSPPSCSCSRSPTTKARPAGCSSSTASRKQALEKAIEAVRGGENVDAARRPRASARRSRNTRSTSPSARAQGKLDPVIGRDDEIRRVHPDPAAAHQEQPGADRRAGRGQDRDRRGPRAAHRQRRSARVAEEQARARRSTWRRCSPAPSTAASSRSA